MNSYSLFSCYLQQIETNYSLFAMIDLFSQQKVMDLRMERYNDKRKEWFIE